MTHAAPAATPSLPADVAALRALVLATMAERDVLAEERDALASQNDRLRHLLIKLQRLQFGRKSERLPKEQLQLGLEDLETVIAEGEAKAEKRDPDLRRDHIEPLGAVLADHHHRLLAARAGGALRFQ